MGQAQPASPAGPAAMQAPATRSAVSGLKLSLWMDAAPARLSLLHLFHQRQGHLSLPAVQRKCDRAACEAD